MGRQATAGVDESVAEGAASVALALSLVVTLRVVFVPGNPVSISLASTIRAPGMWAGRKYRGLALQIPAMRKTIKSNMVGLNDCMVGFEEY